MGMVKADLEDGFLSSVFENSLIYQFIIGWNVIFNQGEMVFICSSWHMLIQC